MKKFVASFLLALLPRRCAYCGKLIPSDMLSCKECEKSLPRIEKDICMRCGREKEECSCKKAEKYFDALVAPFYFEGNVRRGLHTFKFRNGSQNYEAYCNEMAKTFRKRYNGIKFDYVISVPMSKESKKKRGFDQCALLAKKLSELIEVEYYPDALIKIFKTNIQHDLSYTFRKGNLAGAFEVENPEKVKGKTFLLVDDISTSSETLDECAKMLWLYEAKAIYGLTVAVTKRKKK